MTCEECLERIDAYADGQLDPEEAAAVREHLRDCATCAAEHARLAELSRRLRTTLVRYPAPDVLKARIRASVSAADAAGGPSDAPDTPAKPHLRGPAWMRTTAAAVVIAVASSAATALVLRSTAPADTLEREVVASHIRSLMPGHLTDVASTDQHNVKPWFNGRVDLSPPVPRLDTAGFPLVGGRVDYVDGHPTATIVYTRRLHVINVFSWPASAGDAGPTVSPATHGYRIVKERRDGLALWFVSDLNAAELQDFVKRFNAASTPAP